MPLKARSLSGASGRVLCRARAALSADPNFIASLEPLWRSAMHGGSPAEALRCSEDVWYWIAICRRPRPAFFLQDIKNIARATGIDPSRLQTFIVTSLAAERFQSAPPEATSDQAGLLAARKQDDEDE
jgi:hypothetical protein